MVAKKEKPKFKLGDRVRVLYGADLPLVELVEYRGLLAGGRPLWRVKVDLDPPDFFYTEVPEYDFLPDDLEQAKAIVEKARAERREKTG
jgi:hypothetical protein